MESASPPRTLDELLERDDPSWPLVQEWIADAAVPVEVLPADTAQRDARLLETQVTTRSPMGALIYETGGLLIDHGWLRLLGSGHPKLPRSLPEWNAHARGVLHSPDPGYLLIGDDALGGLFALDGGGLGAGQGEVYYYGPDTLKWECLEIKYSAFLQRMMSESLQQFYKTLRWPDWEQEVSALRGDQALSMYPFLWTQEGRNPAQNSRKPVPFQELFSLHLVVFPRQLG